MSPILSCSAFSHACMCRPLTDRLGSAAGPASRGVRPARDGLRWSAGLLPAMAQTRARARPASRAGPCRRLEMFFSTPDLGNLLFAPSDRRFFNPVWFPYFARPTHVEEVPSPSEMGSGLTSLVRRRIFLRPLCQKFSDCSQNSNHLTLTHPHTPLCESSGRSHRKTVNRLGQNFQPQAMAIPLPN